MIIIDEVQVGVVAGSCNCTFINSFFPLRDWYIHVKRQLLAIVVPCNVKQTLGICFFRCYYYIPKVAVVRAENKHKNQRMHIRKHLRQNKQ